MWYIAAAYDRFATVSRATRDAAAAAEIRFVHEAYYTRGATAFALRNVNRVKSLGAFGAPDLASIQMYSQLQDLVLDLGLEIATIALLPHSLTKLVLSLDTVRIDWEVFRPLCCLQELRVYNRGRIADLVQLNDIFATALPLLRVFHVSPGQRNAALETTAKVVVPHLVELDISRVNLVHLDLHFMSALKSLTLRNCNVFTVSAACSTMVLKGCWMREGTVLVIPNLRSLTISYGGLCELDGSECRHALSIVCRGSSIEWVGAQCRNFQGSRNLEPGRFLI